MEKPQTTQQIPWYQRWWGVVLLIVAVLGLFGIGYFVYLVVVAVLDINSGETPSYISFEETIDSPVQTISTEGRPSYGNPDAPVTIVQFCDFQCTYCQSVSATIRKVMVQYADEAFFVFRHYPLESIHPEAPQAAIAAECAFQQGKFWEYHDTLFANQDDLSISALREYARQVGLNTTTFTTCMDDPQTTATVNEDLAAGYDAGAEGTPTFFINGHLIAGAYPETFFVQAIEYLTQQ